MFRQQSQVEQASHTHVVSATIEEAAASRKPPIPRRTSKPNLHFYRQVRRGSLRGGQEGSLDSIAVAGRSASLGRAAGEVATGEVAAGEVAASLGGTASRYGDWGDDFHTSEEEERVVRVRARYSYGGEEEGTLVIQPGQQFR